MKVGQLRCIRLRADLRERDFSSSAVMRSNPWKGFSKWWRSRSWSTLPELLEALESWRFLSSALPGAGLALSGILGCCRVVGQTPKLHEAWCFQLLRLLIITLRHLWSSTTTITASLSDRSRNLKGAHYVSALMIAEGYGHMGYEASYTKSAPVNVKPTSKCRAKMRTSSRLCRNSHHSRLRVRRRS